MANKFDSLTATERASAPTTPATGDWRIYFKSSGLFVVDDAGTEYGPFSTGDVAGHLADTTDAHDASAISYAGGTGMSATDVEAAIDELATEKANLTGGTFSGDISVPDEAYDATAWNGSLEVPTKNAVRDKIETLGGGSVSDAVYGAGWDGDTTTAPSKNAVYDKIETLGGGTTGSGVAFGMLDGNTTNTTISANQMYIGQIIVPQAMTFDRLCAQIVTSSGNIDMALYANSAGSISTRLVTLGSTAVGGTGNKKYTCASTSIAAGVYWLAFAFDNGTAGVRCSTDISLRTLRTIQVANSSFPLPSTPTGLSAASIQPMLWIEKS